MKQSISSVKSNDVIELSKPELRKIGEKIFNNIIYNKEIGEIHCKSKIINGALNYVNTKAEKAALLTVPDVLRKGVVIHIQENHKNRNYPTYTLGAPVEIDGIRGNVGVLVKYTEKLKYICHRILLPNGDAFEIKEDTEDMTSSRINNNQLDNISVSENIIAQDNTSVNKKLSLDELAETLPGTKFSVFEVGT